MKRSLGLRGSVSGLGFWDLEICLGVSGWRVMMMMMMVRICHRLVLCCCGFLVRATPIRAAKSTNVAQRI